ncbi:MAG: preprotein translocase subunit SecG [Bacteroidetes bacterium]|nr:preprotein translocase subunit SecG [Bacteroidota bacterium]MXW83022.1 preprotein translocase subunit SecG [Rhodothermaceae bacterium]MDE2670933.1 preprotein translocase subunit SecG [Bacteroidota bacterium]MXX59392.1 preprotein translocase subunit SecG [Rhodothermaceae bacterium]MYD19347.1 preprotein translocase subunit SecG [Rhodothermaceae bacterium]
MFTFLIVVITLIGIVMTCLILLQAGKGGGLAGIASGGATTQILGARQAPDVLEKGTWIMATVFIVLCVLTNFVIDDGGSQESVLQQSPQTNQQTLPAPEEVPPPPLEDALPPPVEDALPPSPVEDGE